MEKIASVEEWETSNIQAFWGEIAPCDHLAQDMNEKTGTANDARIMNIHKIS